MILTTTQESLKYILLPILFFSLNGYSYANCSILDRDLIVRTHTHIMNQKLSSPDDPNKLQTINISPEYVLGGRFETPCTLPQGVQKLIQQKIHGFQTQTNRKWFYFAGSIQVSTNQEDDLFVEVTVYLSDQISSPLIIDTRLDVKKNNPEILKERVNSFLVRNKVSNYQAAVDLSNIQQLMDQGLFIHPSIRAMYPISNSEANVPYPPVTLGIGDSNEDIDEKKEKSLWEQIFGEEKTTAVEINPPSTPSKNNNTELVKGAYIPNPYHLMKIFYGTNRKMRIDNKKILGIIERDSEYYNGVDAEVLNLGVADVSIPRSHRRGTVERPSIWSLDFKSDADRHVTLHGIQAMESNDFYKQVKSHKIMKDNSALIFIHGFNVPFNSALHSAAVLSYDMQFPGVTMAYSWPSDGKLKEYISDQTDSESAATYLIKFLEGINANAQFDRIHIVAHSMGNRLLTRAMEQLRFKNLERLANQQEVEDIKFENLVMVAPDVDIGLFENRFSRILPIFANRVSLYGSSEDVALIKASENLSGKPRLGSMNPIVVYPNIDTVDATGTGTSFFKFNLDHSYYLNQKFIKDICGLVIEGFEPKNRNSLQPAILANQDRYWVLY